MVKDFLKKHITSQAKFVEYGYGQVEPNHLSAQRTKQIYAQLPAKSDIDVLEQGQFVKYDYAAGVVDFVGAGEWMLVYNETKLYRENQLDCEFAMVKDNYQARVYSPYDAAQDKDASQWTKQTRYFNGVKGAGAVGDETFQNPEDVTAGPDMYEPTYNEDPFHIEDVYHEAMMPEGTTMVPRVYKTNIGDIMTTNTVNFTENENQPVLGGLLCVGEDGILTEEANAGEHAGDMRWQVVKIYTMPDHQAGVKVMRVK